jgi:tetratricopeptide (TPR) repeat protein
MKLADSYATKGDLRNAVVALKQAINLQPQEMSPRMRLAQMYVDLGMSNEAASECNRALLFNKDSLEVHQFLAKLYMSMGRFGDAAEQCNQIVRLDPKNTDARISLGDISWNLAKVDDAVGAYEGAITADPTNILPHERLQKLYSAKKMYDKALEHLIAIRTLSGNPGDDISKKYAILAQILQDEFNDVMGKLDSDKVDFDAGKISREDYYADCKDVTARIEALATYLTTQTAPRPYKDVHPHGVFATSLLAQIGGNMVSYFETERKHYLDDAGLLKDNAKAEMQDFVAGLKTVAAGQPAANPKQGNG